MGNKNQTDIFSWWKLSPLTITQVEFANNPQEILINILNENKQKVIGKI